MTTSAHDLVERWGFEGVQLLQSTSESDCFVAKSVGDGQKYFVKCVKIARYLRELNALAVDHHGVCCLPVDNYFLDSEHCFLIYRWLGGGSLSHLLKGKSVHRALNVHALALRMFEALRAVHEAGLVHGDVKPENFLIEDQRMPEQSLQLTDFGSSAQLSELRARSWRSASPAYEAPESVSGRPGQASDLFSAGVVLYEILLGDRPFHGMPSEIYRQSQFETPPLAAIQDSGLRCLLARLLSTELNMRPESAAEVIEYLRVGFKSRVRASKPPQNRILPSLRLHHFVGSGAETLSLVSDSHSGLFCFFHRFQLRVIDSGGRDILETCYQGPPPIWRRRSLWYWTGADLYRFDTDLRKEEFVAHFRFPPDAFDVGTDGVFWLSAGRLLCADFDGGNVQSHRVCSYLATNKVAMSAADVVIPTGVTASTLMRFTSQLNLVDRVELGGVILDICCGTDDSVHILLEPFENGSSLWFAVLFQNGQLCMTAVPEGFSSLCLTHSGCVVWFKHRGVQVLESVNGRIAKYDLNPVPIQSISV